MKLIKKQNGQVKSKLALILSIFLISGCSVVGNSNVEIAPYKTLIKEDQLELRHYEKMVLVSTKSKNVNDRSSPFSRLFSYISGENEGDIEIPMTAPVFMDKKGGASNAMSFVLPTTMDFDSAPEPLDPRVKLEEVKDFTVATITFNGRLSESNIKQHQQILNDWINQKGFEVIGDPKTAGYNAPYTLPHLRRNEILIPVNKAE